MKITRLTHLISLTLLISLTCCNSKRTDSLNMENYFAWCIVPFDNQNRTPEQRIEMLKNLGFTSYAYDWRVKHLPEMSKEFQLAEENGIHINGVWMSIAGNDSVGYLSENNRKVLQVIKETGLSTQIWTSLPETLFDGYTENEKLSRAAEMVSYLNSEAKKLDCKIALYNHGGWFGNPRNQVKILESIPDQDVGIIFNFHHAHDMLDDYEELVKIMMPYLWAVNLNGMKPDGPKILTVGVGSEEAKMIEILENNGYHGPYGILGHKEDADVEKILQANLEGIKSILEE